MPEPTNRHWPQRIICGLIGLALLAAVTGRIFGQSQMAETGSVVASRELNFSDRADGAVVVTDARTAQTVEVLEGEQGFIRATMRGLARARHSEGVGATAPFRLTAWTDGRLTLDDAATGRHLELQAFGSLNSAVFARLLNLEMQSPAPGHPL